jgi:hypothetical protein
VLSRRGALAGGAALAATPVLAHGFHVSFSVLELNPRSGSLEVFHRIYVQDFELLLTARAGEQVTLKDEAVSAKLMESYLLEVFSVKTPDGQPLRPEWFGMKLQADTALIYREIKNAAGLTGLVIANQILTETHPGQINTVNITARGRTQTLTFGANDPAQSVSF